MKTNHRIVAILAAVLAFGSIAFGADNVWQGTSEADQWSNTTFWSLGHVPTAGEDALIYNSGATWNRWADVTYDAPTFGVLSLGSTVGQNRGLVHIFNTGMLTTTADGYVGSVDWSHLWVEGRLNIGSQLYIQKYGSFTVGNDAGSGGTATLGGWLINHGAMNIKSGASLTNTVGMVGWSAGETGNATVSGTWNNTADLTVGNSGSGALTINSGGVVNGGGFISIGREAGSTGAVTVNGAMSTSGQLAVGANATGTLTIQNGGDVVSTSSRIGQYAGSSGSATITGAGSTWTEQSSMYIGGTSAGSTGATGTLSVANSGALSVANILKVWSSDDAVNLSGGSITAGTIDISDGGAFHFTGGTLSVTNFLGNLLNEGGTLAPGSSPGLLTVAGDYTQESDATLAIELGGTIRGTQYDALDISGALTLDGTLDVSLYGGFNPVDGDSFDILNWGSKSGAFSTVNLPSLSAGLSWDQSKLGTDGKISVIPEPGSVALVALAGGVLAAIRRRRLFRQRMGF